MKLPYFLSLLAVTSQLNAQDFQFRRELAAGARFTLRNIIGDVQVERASGRNVEVTAKKQAGRHGDPEDVEIRAVEIDNGVAICTLYPGNRIRRDEDDDRDDDRDRRRRSSRRGSDPCSNHGSWRGDRNDTSIDFVVRLPAGLDVDIKTVTGDVDGRDIQASEADFGSVSGDVRLTSVRANSLDANSVSGDVELAEITVREASAETVSGDVSFSGPIDDQGRYDFKSLSGDVVLTVPREPNATVTASTFSGRFRSDFAVTTRAGDDSRRRRNRFHATWGKGGAEVDLESFSGNIEVRSAR